jgi:hypothetical protein
MCSKYNYDKKKKQKKKKKKKNPRKIPQYFFSFNKTDKINIHQEIRCI